ncbi:MAG: response regulator transcription factor [Clostridia bacterium]|nr:response regulator transcription factor [Clostridia bacterium]
MNQSDFTIMVADDDRRIRQMLVMYLKGHGYQVLEAENGEQALDLYYANANKIDLILLDVMMPGRDGFEVLEELRDSSLVPVIMVTAKDQEYDQLKGFRYGADDYISKPFSPTVLLARLESVLRRCSAKAQNQVIRSGAIELMLKSKCMKLDGETVILTQKEFDLLTYLMTNPREVLSRNQILNAIWNYDYDGDPRTVDTHIKQLRSKMKDAGAYIRTVHGRGYLFDGPEQ